ncbi:MAG: TAT-variant-translocated molybdopterin oxidoreductase [Acidobacteriota bacterium]
MAKTDHALDLAAFRTRLENEGGPRLWRSLDELSEDENFREYLYDEFPRQAGLMEEDGVDRRSFMKLMGASFALAGLASCSPPVERIVPYVNQPENLVLGVPMFFATAMPLGGYATGLLVESHEGHPTKVEGNPDHPASLGATNAFHQASVLGLYDPDRSSTIRKMGEVSTWPVFLTELQQHLENMPSGEGLRLLTGSITSPSTGQLLVDLRAKFPASRRHQFEPTAGDNRREGSRLAFGTYADTVYRFDQADLIFSIGSDFLHTGPGHIRYARDFASKRRVSGGARTMNRLYAIESIYTPTGAMADHRLPVRASQMEGFARAVAAAVGSGGAASGTPLTAAQSDWIHALAADLQAHRGTSIVVAGDEEPASVHALAHALNSALGNIGRTVMIVEPAEIEPVNQLESLRSLVTDMNAGRVQTLLIIGENPVFDAPADFNFAAALQKVPFRAHLGLYYDETAAVCQWHVPETHYLESWGDARAFDGTVAIIQPLIAPLYGGHPASELIGAISGDARSAHDIVQDFWKARMPAIGFGDEWSRILRAGVVPNTASAARGGAAAQVPAPPPQARNESGLELILRADPTIQGGRFANNGWLQELPKPMTKLTWDNVAHVSPATAAQLGVKNEDEVTLTLNGTTVVAPIWVTPGTADDTVAVDFGYGRRRAGRVGTGIGFDAYVLRNSTGMWWAPGLQVSKNGRAYRLATTQRQNTMEERRPVRSATLTEFLAKPDFAHTEADLAGQYPNLYPEYKYDEQRWAMSIDTSVCTGCGGCVIACQAENNIAVVGKDQVIRERVMQWIRIDRYYAGDPANPTVYSQPVPCMHCEKAPCEPVCPVEATTHSEDGINEMTYNRCIGTRYCLNNCPYKVRRFNFYKYSDYTTESLKFQRNPDVTVRSRGVMEKCSYCVQRIRTARKRADREDRKIVDGEVITACAAACPTEAIVFGDLNDPRSRVKALKESPLNYALLAELNTQPRTTYLATVRNPNPQIKTAGPTETA